MLFIILLFVCWNVFCFCLMFYDKTKAKINGWRISEKTLIICAFAMGAFGIAFGMMVFRHKIRKNKFIYLVPLAIFTNIIILYCLI